MGNTFISKEIQKDKIILLKYIRKRNIF